MVDARQDIVRLLEKALEAAKSGKELTEVGQMISAAADAAGASSSYLQLARETRAKGHAVEADILNLAVDIAKGAEKPSEVYEHSLIAIHDLACERLEEMHDAEHHPKDAKEAPAKERTVSRLN